MFVGVESSTVEVLVGLTSALLDSDRRRKAFHTPLVFDVSLSDDPPTVDAVAKGELDVCLSFAEPAEPRRTRDANSLPIGISLGSEARSGPLVRPMPCFEDDIRRV